MKVLRGMRRMMMSAWVVFRRCFYSYYVFIEGHNCSYYYEEFGGFDSRADAESGLRGL